MMLFYIALNLMHFAKEFYLLVVISVQLCTMLIVSLDVYVFSYEILLFISKVLPLLPPLIKLWKTLMKQTIDLVLFLLHVLFVVLVIFLSILLYL